MLPDKTTKLERMIIHALRQVASNYRKDQGRFLPLAERAIRDALEDWTSLYGCTSRAEREKASKKHQRNFASDRLRVSMSMPDERVDLS